MCDHQGLHFNNSKPTRPPAFQFTQLYEPNTRKITQISAGVMFTIWYTMVTPWKIAQIYNSSFGLVSY